MTFRRRPAVGWGAGGNEYHIHEDHVTPRIYPPPPWLWWCAPRNVLNIILPLRIRLATSHQVHKKRNQVSYSARSTLYASVVSCCSPCHVAFAQFTWNFAEHLSKFMLLFLQVSPFLLQFQNSPAHTHEDGHVGRNISVEQRQLNVRQWTIYNKAARRRQHNLKTYITHWVWTQLVLNICELFSASSLLIKVNWCLPSIYLMSQLSCRICKLKQCFPVNEI
jgi:hypothetical protein